MDIEKINIRLSLFYLVSIATIGLMLRWYAVDIYQIDYKGFLHAHSHIAFLGWIYLAFVVIINHIYVPAQRLKTLRYKAISIFAHLSLWGILISFPLQSYGFFSILFLSLFLIATYFYVWFFRKNKAVDDSHRHSFSFVRAALFFMIFSGLGPWLLGAVIKIFGKDSAMYSDTIYFYLHFQYNGWFLFSLLGISLYFVERQNMNLPSKLINKIWYLLVGSTVLSYFSNTLWADPPLYFNALALLGVMGEWIALLLFVNYLFAQRNVFKSRFSSFQYTILQWVFVLLLLKASLQLFQVFPYFAKVSYQIRNFIIGYLHLLMLGIFTPFLLLIMHHIKAIRLSGLFFSIFYTGFIINELALFSHAILIWADGDLSIPFAWILVIASVLMLSGFVGIFLRSNTPQEIEPKDR